MQFAAAWWADESFDGLRTLVRRGAAFGHGILRDRVRSADKGHLFAVLTKRWRYTLFRRRGFSIMRLCGGLIWLSGRSVPLCVEGKSQQQWKDPESFFIAATCAGSELTKEGCIGEPTDIS